MDNEEFEKLRLRIEQLEAQQKELNAKLEKLTSKKTPVQKRQDPIPQSPPVRTPKPPPPTFIDNLVGKFSFLEKDKIEAFIGENLISKLGILITIIGISIGAKYAIDNELINPLTRIVLGYGVGLVLLLIGFKLRPKYKDYSAVLVSGAMATMYIITYFAYDLYSLISLEIAFGLMVIFTIFTVIAAISYKKQVIAHIGLLGAYSVPFLLGDDPDGELILFSYILLVNIGILIACITQRWKPVLYVSFILTWVIVMAVWDSTDYMTLPLKNELIFVFSAIYFVLFYTGTLVYKLYKSVSFDRTDLLIIVLNAILFFVVGIAMIEVDYKKYLSLFVLGNAALHIGAAGGFNRWEKTPRKAIFWSITIGLIFLTLSIFFGFRDEWIAVLLTVEAGVLFVLGRKFGIRLFERFSLPMMVIAFVSVMVTILVSNFDFHVNSRISSLVFFLVFGSIYYGGLKGGLASSSLGKKSASFGNIVVPLIVVVSLFFGLFNEVHGYFCDLYKASKPDGMRAISNYTYKDFGVIYKLIYMLLFTVALSMVSHKWIRSKVMSYSSFITAALFLLIALTLGYERIYQLKNTYLNGDLSEYYNIGSMAVYIRYVFIAALAVTIGVLFWKSRDALFDKYRIPIHVFLHLCILTILSMEAIHILNVLEVKNANKLILTIVWGAYSIYLVSTGIFKEKTYYRIFGMVVVGISMIKLFLYDMAHQSTIRKTFVFIILGIVLLIISFLYNRTNKNKSHEE